MKYKIIWKNLNKKVEGSINIQKICPMEGNNAWLSPWRMLVGIWKPTHSLGRILFLFYFRSSWLVDGEGNGVVIRGRAHACMRVMNIGWEGDLLISIL